MSGTSIGFLHPDFKETGANYLKQFPYFPFRPGNVEDFNHVQYTGRAINVMTSHVISPFCLETCLDLMIAHGLTPGAGVLYMGHGDPNGLFMPLTATSDDRQLGAITHNSAMDLLLDASRQETAAKFFGVDVKTLTRVQKKIDQVRKKEFWHISFAACRIGQTPANLEGLMQMFGAATATAPKMLDAFGAFELHGFYTGDKNWSAFASLYGPDTVWGESPDRFGLAFDPTTEDSHTFTGTIARESRRAVQDFIDMEMPQTPLKFTGTSLPIHAMHTRGSSHFVFPRRTEYSNNLVHVKRAFPVKGPLVP